MKSPKKLKFKYNYKKMILIVLAIIIGFFLVLAILSVISQISNPPAKNIKYGVTFSQNAAKALDLDWKQTYITMLDDLKIKYLRIPSYWTSIEYKMDNYDFEETDFLVQEAEKRGVKVILTLGVKQPRWPECHIPNWARDLPKEKRQQKVLDLIEKVVNRYKSSPAIYAWQVENEPFFYPYGDNCYPPDEEFLKKEIQTVKALDNRDVIISETGELTLWAKQMQISDVFGTTLYRTVWNKVTGYFNYPVIPGYYSMRSNFFRKFFAPNNKRTIITELQTEPWIPSNSPLNTSLAEQMKTFPLKTMQGNIDFANKTGFDEIYLWGVEWWYFMSQKGHPEYWDYARTLLN